MTISVIKWPQLLLHDYPKELQEVIHLPPFVKKKAAYAFSAVCMVVLVVLLFAGPLVTYGAQPVGFPVVFLHLLVITMCWNVFDLLVMDWLIFCTLRPRFIVLPGSEGHPAYANYAFHFVGLLKGCAISLVGSALAAGLCYGALVFLIWPA